jgi:hypothetical protein
MQIINSYHLTQDQKINKSKARFIHLQVTLFER